MGKSRAEDEGFCLETSSFCSRKDLHLTSTSLGMIQKQLLLHSTSELLLGNVSNEQLL